jgi:hypothetical protein
MSDLSWLKEPVTEIELAELLRREFDPQARAVIRRLAYERDVLKDRIPKRVSFSVRCLQCKTVVGTYEGPVRGAPSETVLTCYSCRNVRRSLRSDQG